MKPYRLILFFLLSGSFVPPTQHCEKLQAMLNRGVQEKEAWNYTKAFEILTRVERQAEKQQCYEVLSTTKVAIGSVYSDLSNYAESLNYYQQALAIIEEHPELNNEIPIPLYNIGRLYSLQGDYKKALEYRKKAFSLAKKHNGSLVVVIGLADVYKNMGELEKGLGVLNEVRGKLKNKTARQLWKITYAEILHLQGKTKLAQKIAEELFLETQKEKKGGCNKCVLKLLSQIYADQNKLDKAIAFAKKGLQYTNTLDSDIEFCRELASLYTLKGEHQRSAHYKDSMIIAKDSLSKIMNRHLFQINRVKFEVQEYQNQIKRNRKKHRDERILFFTLMGLGLISFFFVFKTLKNRTVKQKQKRTIAENKEKIALLQLEKEKKEHHLLEEQSKVRQEQLKNKIAKKNRTLSANALYHSGRNELLEKIISSLSNTPAVSDNKVIKGYIKELKNHLNTASKWEEFTTHFEKANPGFLRNLKTQHPGLTKRDIRFLCYLYMNLGAKEICIIFNINSEVFWKRKQRLAKKMGLQTSELYEYMLNINN